MVLAASSRSPATSPAWLRLGGALGDFPLARATAARRAAVMCPGIGLDLWP